MSFIKEKTTSGFTVQNVKTPHNLSSKLILVLLLSTMVFATLFFTKHVDASSGISVLGDVEVYDSDGVTSLTNYDFPLFNGGTVEAFVKYFFINNTGSVPVYVYWNISSSSICWEVSATPSQDRYDYYEGGVLKYSFGIQQDCTPSGDCWRPDIEAVFLDVGAGVKLRFKLSYTGEPITAETFTLTTSFYAGQYPSSMIEATVNIDPDTLHLKSAGQWITAYLSFPENYNVESIDPSTVRLEDVPVTRSEIQNGLLMCKFSRTMVQSKLAAMISYDESIVFYERPLTITGEFFDGTLFQGTDTIIVIQN